jgi:hypothetical protein
VFSSRAVRTRPRPANRSGYIAGTLETAGYIGSGTWWFDSVGASNDRPERMCGVAHRIDPEGLASTMSLCLASGTFVTCSLRIKDITMKPHAFIIGEGCTDPARRPGHWPNVGRTGLGRPPPPIHIFGRKSPTGTGVDSFNEWVSAEERTAAIQTRQFLITMAAQFG